MCFKCNKKINQRYTLIMFTITGQFLMAKQIRKQKHHYFCQCSATSMNTIQYWCLLTSRNLPLFSKGSRQLIAGLHIYVGS